MYHECSVTNGGVPEVGFLVPAKLIFAMPHEFTEAGKAIFVFSACDMDFVQPDLDASFERLANCIAMLGNFVAVRNGNKTLLAWRIGGWWWGRWPWLRSAVADDRQTPNPGPALG